MMYFYLFIAEGFAWLSPLSSQTPETGLLLSPLYTWGKWSIERLSNWSKVTEPVNVWTKIQKQAYRKSLFLRFVVAHLPSLLTIT